MDSTAVMVAGVSAGLLALGMASPAAAATAVPSQGTSAPVVAKPRAGLTGTATTQASGRILVSVVTADATRVKLTWRTAARTTRVAILRIKAGKGAGYLPAGSTGIYAKALATAARRASVKVALSTPASRPVSTRPPAVTALAAGSVTDTSVTLSWTNPTDASFAGVVVRRALGAKAPIATTAGSDVPLASPTATSLTDSTLLAATTYSYSVFAITTTGQAAPAASVTVLTTAAATDPAAVVALPLNSGQGRRIVWSSSRNRVWAVDAGDVVVRTFAVTDNDELTPPGTYSVIRRNAMAYTDPEYGNLTLPYFLGFFKRCPSCAYIGFHRIPLDAKGVPIQPESTLGSPLYASHGCVRESHADSKFLFDWAPLGTVVMVVP